ncbi:MAG: GNAT family N-acetyltransferase [Oscillospiraceae bacterium]|nr:GNAT family N-acetyltransferase [Oscillospiraceae bacterium]
MKQEIKPLTHRNITTKYFKDWFFNMDDWLDSGATPENFDYNSLTHNESQEIYAYGYFIDDKLDGIMRIIRNRNGVLIDWLYVNPGKQNRGIGTELMSYAIDKFGEECDMRLNVVGLNEGGQRFYDRFGFEKVKPFIYHELATGAKKRCYLMKRVRCGKSVPIARPSRFLC